MILISGNDPFVDILCTSLDSLGRPWPGTTWAELLARAGTPAKPVARWRARVGRWFGARTLEIPGTDRAAASADE